MNFGNPGDGLLGFAPETIPGVVARTGRIDFGSHAGTGLTSTRTTLENPSINGNAAAPAPLLGKFDLGGGVTNGALHPAEHYLWFASFFGKYDTTILEAAVAAKHAFSLHASTTFPSPTLTTYVYDGDGLPRRYAGSRLQQIEIPFGPRAISTVTGTIVSLLPDYWADAVLEAGGTGTAVPTLRGLDDINQRRNYSIGGDPIQVKVTATDATTVSVVCRLGTVDAFPLDGDAQELTKGVDDDGFPRWHWIQDQNSEFFGTPGARIELFLPTTGTYVVGDIYTFEPQLAVWVPSFADQTMAVNEMHGELLLTPNGGDQVRARLNSGTVTLTSPARAVENFGGQGPSLTDLRGEYTATLSVEKDYLDRKVREAIERGTPYAAQLWLRSGHRLTGNHFNGMAITFPNLVVGGATPSITDKNTATETLTATAHEADAGAYTAPVTVEVFTDVLDITP